MPTAPNRPGRRRPPAPRRRWPLQRRELSRLPVPAELIRLIEFGLDHPELVRANYWRHVDERACALLGPLLPSERGLRLSLDPRQDEIIASVSS